MGRTSFGLHRAVPAQAEVIRELYTEATEWLRGKNTNQWLTPWPNAPMRHKRVLEDIAEHKTWIVSDEDITVGTITVDTEAPVDRANNHVWPAHRRSETALYVRRVIVRRSHAGLGLGARLLDWAADVAEQELGSPLLRIDVWTDNQGLHAYYKRQGFVFCEERDAAELPGYPARALFERRTSPNGWREQPPLLIE